MTERLDALMVRTYEKGGEKKSSFTKVGVAWPLSKGEGYRLQLEAVPVPTIYEGRVDCSILLMPPKQNDQFGASAPATNPGDDDNIPFMREWRV